MTNSETAYQTTQPDRGSVPDDILEEAYRTMFSELVDFASKRGASDPEATVQEAFIKAATTDSYSEQGRLRGWLYVIVRNMVINEHRTRQRQQTVPASDSYAFDSAPAPHTDEEFTGVEFGLISDEVTNELVSALGRERAAVIVMTASNIPPEEIASIQGVCLATVRTRLHRARGILAENPRKWLRMLIGT